MRHEVRPTNHQNGRVIAAYFENGRAMYSDFLLRLQSRGPSWILGPKETGSSPPQMWPSTNNSSCVTRWIGSGE
jgi:hypothetical protein